MIRSLAAPVEKGLKGRWLVFGPRKEGTRMVALEVFLDPGSETLGCSRQIDLSKLAVHRHDFGDPLGLVCIAHPPNATESSCKIVTRGQVHKNVTIEHSHLVAQGLNFALGVALLPCSGSG